MEDFEKTIYSAVLGIAGTGKSTLLRQSAEKSLGPYVLCSTTGISAVNLGAGITLNSLLWFFDTASLLDSFTTGRLDYRLSDLYNNGVRRILCDEVSMLSGENLSIICMAIDRLNDTLIKRGKPTLGFTLSGDFQQLPPVSGSFAFESEYWDRFAENITILRTVHRQQDPKFIEALGWVRHGEGKRAAGYFEDIMNKLVDPKFDGTTLYPYNSNVDRQNQYRLEKVEGKVAEYESRRDGKLRSEWKHIPEKLILKINSLVMILANNYRDKELEYCNGDLGTIIGTNEYDVKVFLKRTQKAVNVQYITRLNEETKQGKKETVGFIKYLPVRLAYASTIDKTQSLTLDSVQADIRAKFYKERPGMLYTALSRCRTKEGLRLIGGPKTFVQNCVVNPKVLEFL
jgi:hypothetical protein